MTIYYEALFLSDLFLDAFLIGLSCAVLSDKIRFGRLILSSAFAASETILATFYPYLKVFLIVSGCFIIPFLMRKNKNKNQYLCSFISFLATSAVLAGISIFLLSVLPIDKTTLTYGKYPILLGLSGTVVVCLINGFLTKLKKERNKNEYEYDVFLSTGKREKKYRATYDSGNNAFADDGERVVFVSPSVYSRLEREKVGSVSVMTAGGVFTTETTPGEVTLCLPDGKNVLYRVQIAESKYLFGDKILLHGEMTGGNI